MLTMNLQRNVRIKKQYFYVNMAEHIMVSLVKVHKWAVCDTFLINK